MKTVKKIIVLLCGLGLLAFFSACESEGPAERVGEDIDQGVEQLGERMDDAGEEIREGVDEAGDRMEEAGEEMQR
ncbi:MAG: hypothetical protein SCH71_13395 [Desulfobulbaceae bacterium]|nr:hypothetical protein [Desulfobulbaceae bacterium]